MKNLMRSLTGCFLVLLVGFGLYFGVGANKQDSPSTDEVKTKKQDRLSIDKAKELVKQHLDETFAPVPFGVGLNVEYRNKNWSTANDVTKKYIQAELSDLKPRKKNVPLVFGKDAALKELDGIYANTKELFKALGNLVGPARIQKIGELQGQFATTVKNLKEIGQKVKSAGFAQSKKQRYVAELLLLIADTVHTVISNILAKTPAEAKQELSSQEVPVFEVPATPVPVQTPVAKTLGKVVEELIRVLPAERQRASLKQLETMVKTAENSEKLKALHDLAFVGFYEAFDVVEPITIFDVKDKDVESLIKHISMRKRANLPGLKRADEIIQRLEEHVNPKK